jgi:hypothetical protein
MGQGQAVNLVTYPTPEGAGVELATKPGAEVYRQLTQSTFPPEAYTSQTLVIRYRTDQEFMKKEDMFSYSPTLRRVRHQNSWRRNDRFPQMAMTLDDASGRSAWEYTWTMLGTDVLFRRSVSQSPGPGCPSHKVMIPSGGSDKRPQAHEMTILLRPAAALNATLLKHHHEKQLPVSSSRVLYWLEKHSFYPLRTEPTTTEN